MLSTQIVMKECWQAVTFINKIYLNIIKRQRAVEKASDCFYNKSSISIRVSPPFQAQISGALNPNTKDSFNACKPIAKRQEKRAIIAIARMILTANYSMSSISGIWIPLDPFKVDMPERLKE